MNEGTDEQQQNKIKQYFSIQIVTIHSHPHIPRISVSSPCIPIP